MTTELFEKAYEIKSKLWDLEKLKQNFRNSQLVTFDTLPFMFNGRELVAEMSEEVKEVSLQLNQKFINIIDEQINKLNEQFAEL